MSSPLASRGIREPFAIQAHALPDALAGRDVLGEVSITVIDEADHMADLGFLASVTRILDSMRADGQRLLFSAT